MKLARTIILGAAVASALGLSAAFAQQPAAAPEQAAPAPQTAAEAAPAPVPTETIEISRPARGGRFLENGVTAGGVTLFTFTSKVGIPVSLFETRTSVNVDFRFLGESAAPLFEGKCALGGTAGGFIVDTAKNAQNYDCTLKGNPANAVAMTVTFPTFESAGMSFGGFSIGTAAQDATPELQAILRAQMNYRGVRYVATPTGFGRVAGMFGKRTVTGYKITRDDADVGRVEFVLNDVNKGTITAPVAGQPDREAVLFMALQLLSMPDFYAPPVRDELLGAN